MGDPPTIFVVDDEPYINRSLSFVLKQAGYKVVSLHDGLEAWEYLKRGNRPEILFLDVMMPRMNGFELCQRIKSDPELKDIYVIFLTAKWQEDDRKRAEKAKGDEYLTKPFSPSFVLRRVREILKEREGAHYEKRA